MEMVEPSFSRLVRIRANEIRIAARYDEHGDLNMVLLSNSGKAFPSGGETIPHPAHRQDFIAIDRRGAGELEEVIVQESTIRQTRPQTNLPSLQKLRAASGPAGLPTFRVGILIGPGFIPMDMVGVQTVFGLMPGAELHLLWKNTDLVEGFPDWWTKPTTAFADCPTLDVLAVPMLPPEIQSDPEVIGFVKTHGTNAPYVIGICNGVLLLGAAGLLQGKRVTTSFNSLALLSELGAKEVVTEPTGVVIDGNLYTAGPGVGSFEAALKVVESAFGKHAGQLAELIIEYAPHPPFGTGTPKSAGPTLVGLFEKLMGGVVSQYREDARKACQALHSSQRLDPNPTRTTQ